MNLPSLLHRACSTRFLPHHEVPWRVPSLRRRGICDEQGPPGLTSTLLRDARLRRGIDETQRSLLLAHARRHTEALKHQNDKQDSTAASMKGSGRRVVAWVPAGGWESPLSHASCASTRALSVEGMKRMRWTYSAYTERGKPKVRSSLERRNINFRGLSRFRPPLFWDRFFDHFSGSRPGWAAFSLDFCDLVAFFLGETDGGCKMAKNGAFSINCMDRGWGRGRSLKISLLLTLWALKRACL